MSKLALDHPKRMLHLRPDAGLEFFQLVTQRVAGFGFVQRFALARHHGYLPIHIRVLLLDLFALFNAPITRVNKDHFFLTVQQGICLRDVVRVGCCGCDRVHKARMNVHANVRLHAKVPLVALFGLMHIGVSLALVVLGRSGRSDQRGVHHGARLEHQTAINQLGVDGGQDLLAQPVYFEHVAKPHDGALVGQTAHACIQVGKLLVQRDVVQLLFHGRVGVTKELLEQMNAQHHLCGKRWPASLARRRVRCYQRQQIRPRDHQVHFIEKLTLAHALGDKLKSGGGKAHLFHGSTVTNQAVTGMIFADLPFSNLSSSSSNY